MFKEMKLKDKMSFEEFSNYLDLLKDRDIFLDNIYKKSIGNLDLINFNDFLLKPYYIIERCFFSDIELDYIKWYLYEDVDKKIYDINSNVIADIKDNEALWNYLNQDNDSEKEVK